MEKNKNTEGKFIVIEGIDGAGTTSQSEMLVEWLVSRGRQAAQTCEPSRGPAGLLLRQILSGRTVVRLADGGSRPVHNDVIALLFAADRVDHLDNEVLPLIRDGIDVVSDRYYHSSYTYQSLEGDWDWILEINRQARCPDITYILDVPVEQAEARRKRVRSSEEIYEVTETQKKLEQAYRKLPQLLSGEPILIVDGDRDRQAVLDEITADLVQRFGWD
jgi:dTMP kinase